MADIPKIDKVFYLQIGVQGENIARDIQLDVTDWAEKFPEASFHILFKRYNEVYPYPVVTSYEDGILTWTPSAADTAIEGIGYAEVRAINPDTGMVLKSRVLPTSVENSVSGSDGEVPDPFEEWANQVLAASDAAVQAKEYVEEAADGAAAAYDGMIAGIQEEGSGQRAAVAAKGAEVLASIPADYSETSDLAQRAAEALDIGAKKPLTFEQGGWNLANTPYTKYSTSKRIRTDWLTLTPGSYFVQMPEGYKCILLAKHNDSYKSYGGSLYPEAVRFVLTVKEGLQIALTIGKMEDGTELDILPDEGGYVRMTEYMPAEDQEDEPHEMEPEWYNNVAVGYDAFGLQHVGTGRMTNVWKMPKSGIEIYLSRPDSENTAYQAFFFKKDADGALIPATDYSAAAVDWEAENPQPYVTRNGMYYPYAEGVYFTIRALGNMDTKPRIYCGNAGGNGGRLTNLSPITLKAVKTDPADTTYQLMPTFWIHAAGSYITPQVMMGTVIRLRDAKRISCSAKYSMCAWVYDGDEYNAADWDETAGKYVYNKDNHLVASIYGRNLISTAATGVTDIDLSRYGKTGYAIVAIRAPYTPVISESTIARDEETIGGFRLYDDILDNVYVAYYGHVIIQHATTGNSIIAENIRTLKTTTFPDTMAYKYRGNWTPRQTRMLPMKTPTLGLYSGNQIANVPLANLSAESVATAMQNPNSNFYIGEWATYGATVKGIGGVCANLPFLLAGLEWYAPAMPFYREEDGWQGFHLIHDWNAKEQANQLEIGDWVYGQNDEDSDWHVMMVTDIISINNEIVCIEFLESYMPMWRYRYGWLAAPYDSINTEFSKSEPLYPYFNLVARLSPDRWRRMRDVWSLNTDYTPGTLMCNRGRNSVYCMGDDALYVTIGDETMTSIRVYKDGTLVETITISSRPRVTFGDHELTAIDLIDDINRYGPGYYTLIPDNQETAQESFYVAANPDARQEINQETGAVSITLQNPEKVRYVMCVYKSTNEEDLPEVTTETIFNPDTGEYETIVVPYSGSGEEGYENYRVKLTHLPEEYTGGTLTVANVIEYLGKRYYYNYFNAIYETDYGTFVARADNVSRWINSDAGWEREVLWPTGTDCYIRTSGTTADVTNIVTTATDPNAAGMNYILRDVSQAVADRFDPAKTSYESYIISARGGIAPRTWAFIADNGTVISNAASGANLYSLRLDPPSGAKWLVINTRTPERFSYAVTVKKDT